VVAKDAELVIQNRGPGRRRKDAEKGLQVSQRGKVTAECASVVGADASAKDRGQRSEETKVPNVETSAQNGRRYEEWN
jgi:hypothetical protein